MERQEQPPANEDEGVGSGFVLGGAEINPVGAAAIAGGALAAGAGAYLGARALAKRNAADGRVNPTLAAAITANECSQGKAAGKRSRRRG